MRRLTACAAIVPMLLLGALPANSAETKNWVSAWTAAPDTAGEPLPPQTIRQIVRSSIGGDSVRIRLSNAFGSGPLKIGSAHIAQRLAGADTRPGSGHALSFGGAQGVTIAKGASVLSDPVQMEVAALQELAVSLYLPAGAATATLHGAGMQTAYIATGLDAAAASKFPAAATDDSRYFLTDLEVTAGPGAGAVVVLGDSIADGVGSTRDQHARWPDKLAEQLQDRRHPGPLAVANAGIAGNRLLKDAARPFVGPSALSRLGRDAFEKPGVQWLVLAQGINDISASDMLADPGQHVTAEQVIEGMRTLVKRAHDKGIKVCGTTLLPYGGVGKPFIHSASGEAKRQAVNAWIRTAGPFDAVADLEALLRDASQPQRLLPAFDSGDHLHPNDAAYRVIAGAVAAHCFN